MDLLRELWYLSSTIIGDIIFLLLVVRISSRGQKEQVEDYASIQNSKLLFMSEKKCNSHTFL